MTPETIKAAFDAENWSTIGYRYAGTMQRILTRILSPAPAAPLGPYERCCYRCGKVWGSTYPRSESYCPDCREQPAARPDSAGEGGKDRAGEMAEKRISAFGHYIRFMDAHGTIVMGLPGESNDLLDLLRDWFAEALREYGDELLEKACEKIAANHQMGWARTVVEEIKSLKSSPTGATHG